MTTRPLDRRGERARLRRNRHVALVLSIYTHRLYGSQNLSCVFYDITVTTTKKGIQASLSPALRARHKDGFSTPVIADVCPATCATYFTPRLSCGAEQHNSIFLRLPFPPSPLFASLDIPLLRLLFLGGHYVSLVTRSRGQLCWRNERRSVLYIEAVYIIYSYI